MTVFRKATRAQQPLRIAICGPSGSGKTMTALRIAAALGDRVAVIDTERGSSELYAGEENPDGGDLEFDVVDLRAAFGDYSVENYLKALDAARAAEYPVVVIDSGSHAWAGPGGVLDFVDAKAAQSRSGNSYAAWRAGTPLHNRFVDALLDYPGHLIMTMRTKVEYVQEKDGRGKTQIRKVGLQPVQREGLDYEFTVVLDVDLDHRVTVGKTRCSAIADKSYVKAGADIAGVLRQWLDAGAPEDVARRAKHDPVWESGGRERFFARLSEVAGSPSYDDVKRVCEQLGQAKPSELTEERRERLLEFLASAKGQAMLGAE